MFLIAPQENVRAISVAPKLASRATAEQKTDRTSGLPLWSVSALHMPTDATQKPELIQVTVAASHEPEIEPMVSLFTGLAVGGYTIAGDGGALQSAGLFFRADAVTAPSRKGA